VVRALVIIVLSIMLLGCHQCDREPTPEVSENETSQQPICIGCKIPGVYDPTTPSWPR